MMKFLLIVLLIAVIAVLAWLAARSRRHTEDALPADNRPDAIGPGPSDETAMVPPPSDITVPSNLSSPLPPESQTMEQASPAPEPEVVAQTQPPVEPEPVVEPLPEPDPIVEPESPVEPEPIIEPEPEPVEPEPVIEPDTAGVDAEPAGEPEPDTAAAEAEPAAEPEPVAATHGDPLAEEAKTEMPAGDLDPHAGWESDDDRTIHADPESGLYHTPDSPGYKLGPDGQVFDSEDAAREAGFTRWDQPR
jgi:outer membrane biosynthesis protein TonB